VASSQTKPKKTRRRSTLSPEQKEAAVARLAVAREKRLANNPPAYKNVHPHVIALSDDHEWSLKKVKEYIKYQKEVKKVHQQATRNGVKGAEALYLSSQSYIINMETYLKTGIWLDSFWGKDRNMKVITYCINPAYYHEGKKKGQMKRTKGVYYSDMGAVCDKSTDGV
jgi:hypothetical protein|tara:strand:- start:927 stop:1430 length:504 start_codon:yes stop_codon:yes gene_type:complete